MKTWLMFAISFLALAVGLAAGADSIPAIKELTELTADKAVFTDATRTKPIVLKSSKEAAKYFGADDLAKIAKAVDFEKQTILIFAWKGSGQDRMDYTIAESIPAQVQFSRYKPGRTRDLRPHIKIFALRSAVVWKVE